MEELRYSQIRVSCSTYLDKKLSLSVIIRFENYKLDKVLLGDVASAEVSDPVDGHNPNVLDGAQQILKEGHFFINEKEGWSYFEGDEISPHSRSVRRLDLIVEVVQDDIIDELVPTHKCFCRKDKKETIKQRVSVAVREKR